MALLEKLFKSRKPPVIDYDCVISWGVSAYNIKEGKPTTHNVTGIYVDSEISIVRVTIEKGSRVLLVNMSMERAQEIGLINLKALGRYCTQEKNTET